MRRTSECLVYRRTLLKEIEIEISTNGGGSLMGMASSRWRWLDLSWGGLKHVVCGVCGWRMRRVDTWKVKRGRGEAKYS